MRKGCAHECSVSAGSRLDARTVMIGLQIARSPEDCPQEVKDLISRCTEINPQKRPAALEIVHALERLQK